MQAQMIAGWGWVLGLAGAMGAALAQMSTVTHVSHAGRRRRVVARRNAADLEL